MQCRATRTMAGVDTTELILLNVFRTIFAYTYFFFQDVDINGIAHQVGSAPRDYHDDDNDGCSQRRRSGRWKATVQDVAQTELETIQKSSDARDRGESLLPSSPLLRNHWQFVFSYYHDVWRVPVRLCVWCAYCLSYGCRVI